MFKDGISDQQLEAACDILGLANGEHVKDQLREFAQCLHILDEREALYDGAWQEEGHVDSAAHCRSKAVRVVRGTGPYDKALAEGVKDDAYDLANYAIFWLRNVDADRLGEDVDPD